MPPEKQEHMHIAVLQTDRALKSLFFRSSENSLRGTIPAMKVIAAIENNIITFSATRLTIFTKILEEYQKYNIVMASLFVYL